MPTWEYLRGQNKGFAYDGDEIRGFRLDQPETLIVGHALHAVRHNLDILKTVCGIKDKDFEQLCLYFCSPQKSTMTPFFTQPLLTTSEYKASHMAKLLHGELR